MRFEHTNSYPGTPGEILAMLTNEEFREEVCRRQHALTSRVEVTGSGAGATVVVTQAQSTRGAPAVATRLTGDSVELVQTERWHSPSSAELSIDVPGKPGQLRGTVTLRDVGDGTTEEQVTGELRVKVPLVAAKLESLIGSVLLSAMTRQGEVGRDWLTR